MYSPIANEAVAAGLGAFRTCSDLFPSSNKKSSTKSPFSETACALTPAGRFIKSLDVTPGINLLTS